MSRAATTASGLKQVFESYLEQSRAHGRAGRPDAAWACLEAAHVLGQRATRLHVRAHASMFSMAWRDKDLREIVGQLSRIVTAALFTRIWVPQGNTGGSDVSPLKSMPIPDDLQELLAQFGTNRNRD